MKSNNCNPARSGQCPAAQSPRNLPETIGAFRALLTLLALLLTSAATLAAAPPAQAAAAKAKPNILFLLSDDQNAQAISAMGNAEIRTPAIDSLVTGGFAFRNAYCMGSMHGAVCQPSRAMMMSGRTLYRAPLQLDKFTLLPQTLQQAGYITYVTGKWHNGRPSLARAFMHGRNLFFGGMSDQSTVPVCDLKEGGQYTPVRKGTQFSSELFADAAVDFLKAHPAEKPFFLYVSFTTPHDPRTPPGQYATMYDPAKLSLPPSFKPQHPFNNGEMTVRDERLEPWPRTEDGIRKATAAYYGMITHMDHQVGRILKTLDERGMRDNTLIVFASDHGLALGRHGLLGKQSLYDHSMKAPLIFSGPGLPRGQGSDGLVYLMDIYPTLCELAAIPAPATVESKSLAPLMDGRAAKVRDSAYLSYAKVQRAVRDDRYKLIRYTRINRTQLFDLKEDPNELNDLAADPSQAPRLQSMTELLKQWQTQLDDDQPLTTPNPDPEEFNPKKVPPVKK